MLDSRIKPYIDPLSDAIGRKLANAGLSANTVTIMGGVFGVLAFIALTQSAFWVALLMIVLNRVADGLDGAVARHNGLTDLGGFMDIVFDFIFYSLIPLGFAFASPDNALAACFLVVSFVGTGSSFLAFSVMAEKRGISTSIRGRKSLYYLGGLAEGTETIIALLLMCIFPDWFSVIAIGFGTLCWFTTASRIRWAYEELGDKTPIIGETNMGKTDDKNH